jgi:acetylornithine deacetylase/succinyl-diaminopimelate desuccinylase-like protein
VHSSNRARLDSPAFHLVQALASLVTAEGDPAIAGLADRIRPATASEGTMLDDAARRVSEDMTKRTLGATRWARDLGWRESLERYIFSPTVNIEGLVGGYTGAGSMAVLPHRMVAKVDLRLVPDMTFDDTLAKLHAHLAKNGFADIEVNVIGSGYDPTSTALDAPIVQAALAVYRRARIDPLVMPRSAGSWPGHVFTGERLRLPAVIFGLGHGAGMHAPDEYLLIEPANAKVASWDGAVASYVAFLSELAV